MKYLLLKFGFFCLFIVTNLGQINYNEECSTDIRNHGLVRLWKSEDPRRPLLELESFVIESPLLITRNNPYNDTQSELQAAEHRLIRIPMLSCLSQDSEQLIEKIHKEFWDEKKNDLPCNLSFSTEDYLKNPKTYGGLQAMEVDDLVFKGKITDGFFFEAGAYDFQDQSSSLYFELKYNWTGILVEPNDYYYQKGIKKNRNVKSSLVCLSFEDHPNLSQYNHESQRTHKMGDDSLGYQCLPLYSLLLAAGNPTVNYLSLDIEGGEFQVLKTIPWDKVDIQVMSIESHFLGIRTPGTLEDLIEYLDERGYKHIPGAHQSGSFSYINNQRVFEEMELENDLFVRYDIAKDAGL